MAAERRTVVFDVMGTLFDLTALDAPLAELGAAPMTREAWFERALDSARTLTIVGRFEPFSEIATAALRSTLAQQGLDPGAAEEIVAKLRQAPPFPDAAEAFDVLEQAGARIAVLTNGGEEQTVELLERAGLRGRVAEVVTTAEVEAYKPDPRPYRRAAERLGADPGELTLVAAHGWDVIGARSAGLRAVWVDRMERVWPFPTEEPDLRASDLVEAARLAARS